MRYSKNENSILVGNFSTGTEVTIRVLSLDTNEELILDTNKCIEHDDQQGLYMWSTKNINYSNKIDHYANLVYIMSNGVDNDTMGKFTYSGYLDDNNDLINTKLDMLISFKEQYDRLESKIDTLVESIEKIDILNNKTDQILEFETRFKNVQEQLSIEYQDIMTTLSNIDAKLT